MYLSNGPAMAVVTIAITTMSVYSDVLRMPRFSPTVRITSSVRPRVFISEASDAGLPRRTPVSLAPK